MRHMPFLAGCHVYIRSLCIGMGLQGGGCEELIMHLYIVHGITRKIFDARLQVIGQAGLVALSLYRNEPPALVSLSWPPFIASADETV